MLNKDNTKNRHNVLQEATRFFLLLFVFTPACCLVVRVGTRGSTCAPLSSWFVETRQMITSPSMKVPYAGMSLRATQHRAMTQWTTPTHLSTSTYTRHAHQEAHLYRAHRSHTHRIYWGKCAPTTLPRSSELGNHHRAPQRPDHPWSREQCAQSSSSTALRPILSRNAARQRKRLQYEATILEKM